MKIKNGGVVYGFLSLKDYTNELFIPIMTLNRGFSTSETLKNIQEVYLPNVNHKQKSVVLDALINEEKRQRIYINNSLKGVPSNEKIPLNFNENLFKKKIEKLDILVDKYNQLVKLPLSSKRDVDQKKLLNKFCRLIFGNGRELYFPCTASKVIKKVKSTSFNYPIFALIEFE